MIGLMGEECWGHLGSYLLSLLFWTFSNVQMKIQKCIWLISLFRNMFVYDISLVTLSEDGATQLFNLKLHNLSDD